MNSFSFLCILTWNHELGLGAQNGTEQLNNRQEQEELSGSDASDWFTYYHIRTLPSGVSETQDIHLVWT